MRKHCWLKQNTDRAELTYRISSRSAFAASLPSAPDKPPIAPAKPSRVDRLSKKREKRETKSPFPKVIPINCTKPKPKTKNDEIKRLWMDGVFKNERREKNVPGVGRCLAWFQKVSSRMDFLKTKQKTLTLLLWLSRRRRSFPKKKSSCRRFCIRPYVETIRRTWRKKWGKMPNWWSAFWSLRSFN